MSVSLIAPDYNWKEAATQEGVDYQAVQKSFMDQAYGVVANKARQLFQDPYRLGFEIVHRNEKATKMVGIFAFRCNGSLIYAPVFFVNGEIKSADMMYRADVKKFVPLTDDWCAYLVRGANATPGVLEDKARRRQPDAHMERLAFPQRTKYAAEEAEAALEEMLKHSVADEGPMRKLVPELINQEGPIVLEKLAAMIDGSAIAQTFVSETYTLDELSTMPVWLDKRAAEELANRVDEQEPFEIIRSLDLSKSAAERGSVIDHGYALVEKRAAEAINASVNVIEDDAFQALAGPGKFNLLKSDGSTVVGWLLRHNGEHALMGYGPSSYSNGSLLGNEYGASLSTYLPETKEFRHFGHEVYGNETLDHDPKLSIPTTNPAEASVGKIYIMVDQYNILIGEPFVVDSTRKDGSATIIETRSRWGSKNHDIFYSPGRDTRLNSGYKDYISDDVGFLEIDGEVDKSKDTGVITALQLKWDTALMDTAGIRQWMMTAGDTSHSSTVTVKKAPSGLFDVKSTSSFGQSKAATAMDRLDAHLHLAREYDIDCGVAGNLLDLADRDRQVTRRVYLTTEKSAFTTRAQPMQQWIKTVDPQLGVPVDSPQVQVLQTHTPQRSRQQQNYGDHWDRNEGKPKTGDEDALPMDAVLSKSPEELATLSQQFNMPHIFDHGALTQMATSMFNTVNQIQQYIPDLETGVDRYFRILFLIRYRPADFEEAYGKDELMEMEQELSELANLAGENLLRMLKRFDQSSLS